MGFSVNGRGMFVLGVNFRGMTNYYIRVVTSIQSHKIKFVINCLDNGLLSEQGRSDKFCLENFFYFVEV